ncbi:hypothetical protein [Nocardia carnea]|uniref:hypothetical protein n=1 Tax=Nocardia carnea TaxID=37328 RepID=UPI00245718B7|nr:hypothetical protein [Nocardia carnea]
MTDDNSGERPLKNLITEAQEGRMSVTLKPEEFVNIDRDCIRFLDLIDAMRRKAEAIGDTEPKNWGLGADNPLLTSAQTLVARFREKGKNAPDKNDVYSILEENYKIIEDIQTVHKIILDRYMQADTAFADAVRQYEGSLGAPAPIEGKPRQPGVTAYL